MEKEERKRNIVIKELDVRKRRRRKGAEKLLAEIEAKEIDIIKMKKIGEEKEKGKVVIELESEEEK